MRYSRNERDERESRRQREAEMRRREPFRDWHDPDFDGHANAGYHPWGGYRTTAWQGREEPARRDWSAGEDDRKRGGDLERGRLDQGDIEPWGGRRYGDPGNWTGPYAGVGPRDYVRSDERIREEVSECLMRHGAIDASDIEVKVADGVVTLEGNVVSRAMKRAAEDVVDMCSGVQDVRNELEVRR